MSTRSILKVGIFYDGNFFHKVSSYYRYAHRIGKWISIKGFHDFIKNEIAILENMDKKLIHIVTAHFFRGRLPAKEAYIEDKLYSERVLEDILLSEGVVTHTLPVKKGSEGRKERGIDVWFALEAYESVITKNLNYLILITGDGDFVPLVKKVQSVGTKVIIIGWDFEYVDEDGEQKKTSTSLELISAAIHSLKMWEIIEEGITKNKEQVLKLFFDVSEEYIETNPKMYTGKISSVKLGYGFIVSEQLGSDDIFFHFSNIRNLSQIDPKELLGKEVKFKAEKGAKGHEYHATSVYIVNSDAERKR
ncbi:MAG: NYN domain-containing protein [Candidatus Hydrogenedentes bacterium]|nr:NYN domain-containing protein [Candidatus Hydrogenedentota bacterium]